MATRLVVVPARSGMAAGACVCETTLDVYGHLLPQEQDRAVSGQRCDDATDISLSEEEGPRVTPEEQLAGFLAKFMPEIADDAKGALSPMRAHFPGTIEMVYDN